MKKDIEKILGMKIILDEDMPENECAIFNGYETIRIINIQSSAPSARNEK